MIPPSLDLERTLLAGGARFVVGIDEVGRGALAGPVSVGVVVVDHGTGPAPDGLTDSKALTPQARERLEPLVAEWCVAWAVGHATAREIDALGIIRALRTAALRALATLPMRCEVAILDGSHDWLTGGDDLFSAADEMPVVTMRVKADLSCASVAAASVLAKTARDRHMTELDALYPGYGLAGHKGYGSATHRAAIRALGPSDEHRRTWTLLPPETEHS